MFVSATHSSFVWCRDMRRTRPRHPTLSKKVNNPGPRRVAVRAGPSGLPLLVCTGCTQARNSYRNMNFFWGSIRMSRNILIIPRSDLMIIALAGDHANHEGWGIKVGAVEEVAAGERGGRHKPPPSVRPMALRQRR